MTYRFRKLIPFCAISSLALTVACGSSVFKTDDDTGGSSTGGSPTGGSSSGGGSVGGSQNAGGSSSGGASTGGVSTGGAAAGGGSTGGSSTGGTTVSGTCDDDSDCVAVLDAAAPCYGPSCSAPFAASREDVAQNQCLVLWEARNEPAPEDCARAETIACPALCAEPPSCVTPSCESGQCQVKLGYSDEECSQGGDCTTLNEKRQAALDAARACNPNLDNIQCNASETVEDMCGCPLVVNETQPELVKAAREARAAWSAASCIVACPLALCAVPATGACGSNGVCTAK